MTHTALIRIAQVVTADVMLDHDTIRAGASSSSAALSSSNPTRRCS